MKVSIVLRKVAGKLTACNGGAAMSQPGRRPTMLEAALALPALIAEAVLNPLIALVRAIVHTVRVHRSQVLQVPAVKFAAILLGVFLVDTLMGATSSLVGGLMAVTYPADAATLASAEVVETFKRAYLEASDAVPDSTPITAQLNRTRKFKGNPDGLYFHVKLETGGAVANVGDGGMLPRPSRPKGKQGKTGLTHTYTVVAVGGQSIKLTDNSKNAFVSNLESQLEDGMTRVQNDLERQYNGDGRGILAIILTVVGAPTYTLEKPYGVTGAGPGTMLLIEDMDVAIVQTNGTERGRAKVVSVNPDTDQVTLSGSPAGAAIGDYLVLCNDVGATGTDKATNFGAEAAGILAAAGTATGTFENIDATTQRRWRPSVVASGGGALTERKAMGLDSRIMTKSGKRPNLYYTTEGIKLDLLDSLASKRRYEGEVMTIKGGYEGLNLNGRVVLTGPWCPKGHFFALNTEKDSVGMVDVVKMGYVDLDGAKLHRIEGRHAYRADLYFAHQAIWFSRTRHGVLTGLTDDNTIVR